MSGRFGWLGQSARISVKVDSIDQPEGCRSDCEAEDHGSPESSELPYHRDRLICRAAKRVVVRRCRRDLNGARPQKGNTRALVRPNSTRRDPPATAVSRVSITDGINSALPFYVPRASGGGPSSARQRVEWLARLISVDLCARTACEYFVRSFTNQDPAVYRPVRISTQAFVPLPLCNFHTVGGK